MKVRSGRTQGVTARKGQPALLEAKVFLVRVWDLSDNRGKNRKFFDFALEIVEFCPNSQFLLLGTGNNKE